MKLHEYTQEIFNISAANDVSWDVGKDMFLANIRNAGQDGLPYYHGADGLDYAALKPHYDELVESSVDFGMRVQENYEILTALRREGMEREMMEIMLDE